MLGQLPSSPPPSDALRKRGSKRAAKLLPTFSREPDRLAGRLCLSFSATDLRTFLLAPCSLSPKPPAKFSPGEPQKAGGGERQPSKGPPNHTCRRKKAAGVGVLLAAQSLTLFSPSDQYRKGQLRRLGSVLSRGKAFTFRPPQRGRQARAPPASPAPSAPGRPEVSSWAILTAGPPG